MVNLKSLRLEKGLTQQQVADILQVGRTTYTQYETGSSRPDLVSIALLANLFAVPIAFLLEYPPFDVWNLIDSNRKAFLEYAGTPTAINEMFLDTKSVLNEVGLHDFVNFVDATVQQVTLTAEGDFDVMLRPWVYNAMRVFAIDNKTILEIDEYPMIAKYRRLNDSGKEYIDAQLDFAMSQDKYCVKEKRPPHIPDMAAIREEAEAYVNQLKNQNVPTKK